MGLVFPKAGFSAFFSYQQAYWNDAGGHRAMVALFKSAFTIDENTTKADLEAIECEGCVESSRVGLVQRGVQEVTDVELTPRDRKDQEGADQGGVSHARENHEPQPIPRPRA